jgi:RNA polymerase primary sigma factor
MILNRAASMPRRGPARSRYLPRRHTMTGGAAGGEVDSRCRLAPERAPAVQSDAAQVSVARKSVAIEARRVQDGRIRFVGHPSFHDSANAALILGPLPGPEDSKAKTADSHSSSAVRLQEHALLTREQETHLFRKYNFLKYRAAQLIESLDPDRALAADLDRIEEFRREARAARNRIIGSNLALVVFVARRWGATGHGLFELVSDGNVALLRAAERFDFARGVRFSTYAYWAITRDFARRIPKERIRRSRFATGHETALEALADYRDADTLGATDQEQSRNSIQQMLGQLDKREQTIIALRFGLFDDMRTLVELGRELGISKERVRQIESRALCKLREFAESRGLDPTNS